jgi:hypothetical protein
VNVQIISQSVHGAEVVLKERGKSITLHLKRGPRGDYTDAWLQRYDLGQPALSPTFLAEWYGRRAAYAVKTLQSTADALVRTAIRYAFAALPDEVAIGLK